MSELAEFMTQPVTVRTLTGAGGLGDTFAAPVVFTVFCDETRSMVRGRDDTQVLSSCTIFDDNLAHAGAWLPGSDVLLPSGRTAKVIAVARRELDALELPEHLEVKLT